MAKEAATSGELIRQLASIRKRLEKANKVAEALSEKRTEIQQKLLDLLDEQGTVFAGTDTHRATITEVVVPTAKDWDAIYEFMKKEDAPYMLERRLLATVYREMLEAREGEPIPGIEPFTKRTISLRAVSR